MTTALFADERSTTISDPAWLLASDPLMCISPSDDESTRAAILEEFDENVAACVVAEIHRRTSDWTIRTTAVVVLDVLEETGRFTMQRSPVPVRELVPRAHRIARQIVPESRWSSVW